MEPVAESVSDTALEAQRTLMSCRLDRLVEIDLSRRHFSFPVLTVS
jgi:hypothetical protein